MEDLALSSPPFHRLQFLLSEREHSLGYEDLGHRRDENVSASGSFLESVLRDLAQLEICVLV